MNNILFINSKNQSTTSYKYGIDIFSEIKKIKDWQFFYVECETAKEIEYYIFLNKPQIILCNYFSPDLDFINNDLLTCFPSCTHIALMHEFSQKQAKAINDSLFNYCIITDPSFKEDHPLIFKTQSSNRNKLTFPLLKYLSNYKKFYLSMQFAYQSIRAILQKNQVLYDIKGINNLEENFSRIFKTIAKSQDQSLQSQTKFNKILDDKARAEYKDIIDWMHSLSPEMMQRKIPRANVQQAFVFNAVRHFYHPEAKILCVGSHEDTAFESLKQLGIAMDDIDPVKDYDLNTFYHLPTTQKSHYDIIFSTSVIEHVQEDDLFLVQIQELLKFGGVAILTCDFKDDYKNEDYIFPGNYRFYTQENLLTKLKHVLSQSQVLDVPMWDCPHPDFFFEGQTYTFASLVFKRQASAVS